MLDGFLVWVKGLPDVVVYALLGAGSAIENVVPAIPADTFVVFGGFLTALGGLSAGWVFAVTWFCNVASAVAMYRVGHTHGPTFFQVGWGRHLLNPHQVERMALFYERWGTAAVFLTRFLPGLRSVVPVFAGVTRQKLLPVAAPIALASAIWYGALVWAGAFAGRNLDAVLLALGQVNRWLLVVAAAAALAVGVWWWRSRHGHHE